MRTSKRYAALPIGRTARLAFELDAMRGACCKAANSLMKRTPLDAGELEECARLEEALAKAHRILKAAVRGVVLSRLERRSRAK